MKMRKKIPMNKLLARHEMELISQIVLDCLGSISIYPEIWELKIEAQIDRHMDESASGEKNT